MALEVTERPIVIVMGVAGSGKTTVGRGLADRLGLEFSDADDLHDQANIAKMARGEGLSDADRSGWLSRVRSRIDRALEDGAGLVLACSALKESYRRQLGAGRGEVSLVYLRVAPELAERRLRARRGHFMPPSLVASQFSNLEAPAGAIVIDADRPVEAIVSQIAGELEKRRD
jgi:gluconokinase